MKYLDLTFADPPENLACDEVLLDACEAGGGGEVLRVWESAVHFVVVGYGNRVGAEVDLEACRGRNVPVLRRCTGGGTVVQGAGCMNYALILRVEERGPLHSITAANQFVMERNRAAIEALVRCPVNVCGCTDLAIGGRKFSGNAQRRCRHSLLFHGSFLLNFDLTLLSEILRMPSRQPAYRANRVHLEFLMNLGIPAANVHDALRAAWGATTTLERVPLEEIALRARDKYATNAWTFRL